MTRTLQKNQENAAAKTRLSLYLHDTVRRQVRVEAAKADLPMSDYIEEALLQYIARTTHGGEKEDRHRMTRESVQGFEHLQSRLALQYPEGFANTLSLLQEARFERDQQLEHTV